MIMKLKPTTSVEAMEEDLLFRVEAEAIGELCFSGLVHRPHYLGHLGVSTIVTKAEIILVLKLVESGYSYLSFDNIVAILRKMDPNSEVMQKLHMDRTKASYMMTHGLLPYYRLKIVAGVKAAEVFCLGTDSATFKQLGVSKHTDLVLRFWDPERNGIVDVFYDYHSVGHEPADLQAKNTLSSLQKDGISITNLLCISRDNPNVMIKFARLVEEAALAANNPKIIDAPCYLHPVSCVNSDD